jgi:redox-sensitive bicupin YhaK (pirin superfamily)
VKPGYTAFAYVLDGTAHFDDRRESEPGPDEAEQWSASASAGPCGRENVILYEYHGDRVVITSLNTPVRFLYLSGRPLREPVAWRGPVVMNSDEDLRIAFRELQNGTFIKKG